jgi:hypothetical protein
MFEMIHFLMTALFPYQGLMLFDSGSQKSCQPLTSSQTIRNRFSIIFEILIPLTPSSKMIVFLKWRA